jgi:hypothetical protein
MCVCAAFGGILTTTIYTLLTPVLALATVTVTTTTATQKTCHHCPGTYVGFSKLLVKAQAHNQAVNTAGVRSEATIRAGYHAREYVFFNGTKVLTHTYIQPLLINLQFVGCPLQRGEPSQTTYVPSSSLSPFLYRQEQGENDASVGSGEAHTPRPNVR